MCTVDGHKSTEDRDLIYFSTNWMLPKYQGWSVQAKDERVVVLVKRYSIFERVLILTRGVEAREIDVIVDKIPHNKWLTQIYWHNFTDVFPEVSHNRLPTSETRRIRVGGNWYEQVSDSNKLLHFATFVINLENDLEEIIAAMDSSARNKFRRAQKRGAVVTFETTLGEWIEEFYKFFQRLNDEFALPIPEFKMLQDMFAGQNAIGVVARGTTGVEAVNIIYLAFPHAYYMLGAGSKEQEQGVGQLMQLETIKYLKEGGFKSYDLGGVNFSQRRIFEFKKSLGGDFCDLGSEWILTPKIMDLVLKIRRSLPAKWRTPWTNSKPKA